MKKKKGNRCITVERRVRENDEGKEETTREQRNSVDLALLNPFRGALTGFIERNFFLCVLRSKIFFGSLCAPREKKKQRREGKTWKL